MSHASCVVYSIFMAAFSVGLFYAGISMGWLYLFMGVIISSAVLPASLTLLWKDQNWIAAALSPVLGLTVSLIAWLVTARKDCGGLTVECTGSNYPMLAGNVAALLSPVVFIPILTFAFGKQNYDWVSMMAIRLGDDTDIAASAHIDLELVPGHHKPSASATTAAAAAAATEAEAEQAKLKKSAFIARTVTVVMTLILLVLWPMPLYGSSYIFSKKFFTGWVTVGILWLFCSTACVGVFPLWQGRKTMAHTVKSMWLDMRGKYHPQLVGRMGVVEGEDASVEAEKGAVVGEKEKSGSGSQTPEEKGSA
jgi:urea-proton symporter